MPKFKVFSLFFFFCCLSTQHYCSDDEIDPKADQRRQNPTSTLKTLQAAWNDPRTQAALQTTAFIAQKAGSGLLTVAQQAGNATMRLLQETINSTNQRDSRRSLSPQTRHRSTSETSSNADYTAHVEEEGYEDADETQQFFPDIKSLQKNLSENPEDVHNKLYATLRQYFNANGTKSTRTQHKMHDTLRLTQEAQLTLPQEIAKIHAARQIAEMEDFTKTQTEKQQNIETRYEHEHNQAVDELQSTIQNAIQNYLEKKKELDTWRSAKLEASHKKGLIRAKNAEILNAYAGTTRTEDSLEAQIKKCATGEGFQNLIIRYNQAIQTSIDARKKRAQQAQALIAAVEQAVQEPGKLSGTAKKEGKKK